MLTLRPIPKASILIACLTFVWAGDLLGQTSAPLVAPSPAETAESSESNASLAELGIHLNSQDSEETETDKPAPIVSTYSGDWISQSIGDEQRDAGLLNTEAEVFEPIVAAPSSADYQHSFGSILPKRRDYYRRGESGYSWLPATGDNLGWLSLASEPYHRYSKDRAEGHKTAEGLNTAMNIHWLNGPADIDLPARVYDFVLGYQKQETINQRFTYDVSTSIGVYSDFEDSARDGIRFVSHAVGMVHGQRADFVFGVDYLDRDDIPLLPVIGFSFRPVMAPSLQIDAIFPRPEISWAFSSTEVIYARAMMGGGSWDIEFPNEDNDVMTYRDYQILFGVHRRKKDQSQRCELGFVFQRQLEFRNRSDRPEFDNAFIIRFVTLK